MLASGRRGSKGDRVSRACYCAGMTQRVALVGSTGLVGGLLLDLLLSDERVAGVTSLVRRKSGRTHARLLEVVVDFDAPGTLRPHLAVDDVFCCLGTTIKKAGSQEAFRKVDHGYPLAVVRAAAEEKATRALVCTAVGADPASRTAP